jgi:hypothetical protein
MLVFMVRQLQKKLKWVLVAVHLQMTILCQPMVETEEQLCLLIPQIVLYQE